MNYQLICKIDHDKNSTTIFKGINYMTVTAGKIFRALVNQFPPLQILGTINPFCALLAEQSGAKAIYLSGAGVANASHGIPDLGMTNLNEVLEDARRIIEVSKLPLLVDIDTGWGHAFNIARTIKCMEKAGVAAVHLEDQVTAKRCGHRPNKSIVSTVEMSERIKAAVDGRTNPDFVIMARTDAYANEGLASAIERSQHYIEAGADMIFAEAISTLEEYYQFTTQVHVPVLANITEFGKTPLFTREQLYASGIKMILYPLSAFRAMALSAQLTYQQIIEQGTQNNLLDKMQSREALYEVLNYHHYEQTLDQFRETMDEQ